MPRRPPLDPCGTYHVGSRGTYGRPLFRSRAEHELFLGLYTLAARKHGWQTLAWALMKNHHHFVIELTRGGLSEGLRELHGGYSRRIHAAYGQTRMGHLFRHAFFSRELRTSREVIAACAYVDLNPSAGRLRPGSRKTDWCGCGATLGIDKLRAFHTPERLLRLIGSDAARSRVEYRELLNDIHARGRLEASPNDGVGSVTEVARD